MYQQQLDAPFQSQQGSSPNYGSSFSNLGTNLGMIGGGIAGLNQENPANAAMPYLNRIGSSAKPYFDPYINAGNKAIPTLQEQYAQLLGSPDKLMNRFGENFKTSPGYEFNLEQDLNAAGNAAAQGGMSGSPAHQYNAMGVASGLASNEYGDYINHLLGLYGQGLSGTQNMYQGGLQAGTNYSDLLASQLATQAQLAYAGQANQNQQEAGGWGSILGGAGNIAGNVLGGPIGGAIGNTVGKWAGDIF